VDDIQRISDGGVDASHASTMPEAGTEAAAAAAAAAADADAALNPVPKSSPAGRPLVAPGRRAPHPILGRDDEVLTKEEWQRRLATKHLADAYPQQFGQTQELGTRSMLGLFESTGPLLGEDPKRLGRFRVITLATTGIMVGVIFANMPAHDHKGRPTILSSVSMLLNDSQRLAAQWSRCENLISFCATISS
jgi:hypothetical protein